MPKGFFTLLCAQFFSSWADNALLIVAISLLLAQGEPAWTIPLLKSLFTLSYVLLAPWVGASADNWPTTRIMWLSHSLKLIGVFLMLAGVDALLAYTLVGVGAALYSPAKYAWITQMVPPHDLVRANSWIDTSTVCAAIGGVACGGWWISAAFLDRTGTVLTWVPGGVDRTSLSVIPVAWVYGVSLWLTFRVPPSPPHPRATDRMGWRSVEFFWHDWKILWLDARARTSLCVTTLFWGVMASMQLLFLSWAQIRLGLPMHDGAYLQGLAGLGVMGGAWWVGRKISLFKYLRVLPCAVALGLLLPVMDLVHDWHWALPLTLAVGVLGGMLVVPMNAILQYRGHQLLTSGRSIAVQNFNENLGIMVILALYAGLVDVGISFLGLLMLFAILMIAPATYFLITARFRQNKA